MNFKEAKKFLIETKTLPFRQGERCVDYAGNLCILTSKDKFKECFETYKMNMLKKNKMVVMCEVHILATFDSAVGKQTIVSNQLAEAANIADIAYNVAFKNFVDCKLEFAIVNVYATKGSESVFIDSWLVIMDT